VSFENPKTHQPAREKNKRKNKIDVDILKMCFDNNQNLT
jgi:hypothetical protein